MKYLKTYILFEDSSLSRLGIPNEVMQSIQKDYNVPIDATWERLSTKNQIKEFIHNDRELLIELNVDYIKIISIIGGGCIIENFSYQEGEWGGGFEKGEREDLSVTLAYNRISAKSLLFHLKSGSKFEVQPMKKRKLDKQISRFDEITFGFKVELVKDFNEIVKKMYGVRSKQIIEQILKNVEEMPKYGDIGEDWKWKITKLINDNAELKKLDDDYKKMILEDDVLGLKKLEKQYNSLNIFDEYLIQFEVEYSEKFNYHLTIENLIDDFGMDRIKTAFLYYLYSGKLLALKI